MNPNSFFYEALVAPYQVSRHTRCRQGADDLTRNNSADAGQYYKLFKSLLLGTSVDTPDRTVPRHP
jgi:hypothetical protein